MIMMNQYNKETSQIHAPADLIRRTKEAVREEELRIASEKQQPKHSYAKVYKWALPVAAAAVCLIMFNIGVMKLGRGIGKMQSDTSMDMASGAAPTSDSGDNGMDMHFGTAEMYEEEAAEEPVNKSEDTSGTATDIMEQAAAADDTYANADYDGGQTAEINASAASEASDSYHDSTYNGAEGSYIDSIYGSSLWIEKVNEAPSFYSDSDTEDFLIHGVEIYVAHDVDDTWIAYTRKNAQRYVISGEWTEDDLSREEFAEKAYELLMETIDNEE